MLVLVDLLFQLINYFFGYLASFALETLYRHIKQISLGSYLAYCAPPQPQDIFLWLQIVHHAKQGHPKKIPKTNMYKLYIV